MKILTCKDMGIQNCDYIARGETEEEVMQNMLAHHKKEHDTQNLTEDELKKGMKPLIKEE